MAVNYDKINMEIYDLVYDHCKKKYPGLEVAFTGTIDPEYYAKQIKNKSISGLEINVRSKHG